jgi:hypothetical protein
VKKGTHKGCPYIPQILFKQNPENPSNPKNRVQDKTPADQKSSPDLAI